jgi:hypothetical protein
MDKSPKGPEGLKAQQLATIKIRDLLLSLHTFSHASYDFIKISLSATYVTDTPQNILLELLFIMPRYLSSRRHFTKSSNFYNVCYLSSGR